MFYSLWVINLYILFFQRKFVWILEMQLTCHYLKLEELVRCNNLIKMSYKIKIIFYTKTNISIPHLLSSIEKVKKGNNSFRNGLIWLMVFSTTFNKWQYAPRKGTKYIKYQLHLVNLLFFLSCHRKFQMKWTFTMNLCYYDITPRKCFQKQTFLWSIWMITKKR
jgi:hypothetical protein